MDHRHHVERLGDGVGVADLLVPPVTLVVGVPQHGEGQVRMLLLVGPADVEGAIDRGVVDDQDLAVPLVEDLAGDPLQHLHQGPFGLVGDDEDQEARLAGGSGRGASVRRP
jgi:hypothetical protein